MVPRKCCKISEFEPMQIYGSNSILSFGSEIEELGFENDAVLHMGFVFLFEECSNIDFSMVLPGRGLEVDVMLRAMGVIASFKNEVTPYARQDVVTRSSLSLLRTDLD